VAAAPPPPPSAAQIFGVDFSPYTVGDGPGAAVPDSRIQTQLAALRGKTQWIKIAGVTGGLADVPQIAHGMGFHVAAAAYVNTDAKFNQAEYDQLLADVRAGYIDLALIGSEAVWDHFMGANDLAARMNQFRSDIRAFSRIPVATVEPDQAWLDNPVLGTNTDVVVANVTPFSFAVPYGQALGWFQQHYYALANRYHKPVFVGETEWPSDGGAFCGRTSCAVANAANAAGYFAAIEHWARPRGINVFYFEAFDEPWLQQADSKYGPHWGIFTSAGQMKPGMDQGFLTP